MPTNINKRSYNGQSSDSSGISDSKDKLQFVIMYLV